MNPTTPKPLPYDSDKPLSDYGIDTPRWIESDLTPADVEAIQQGGCDSGAYMPAVTYHKALATMSEHGDAVLDYLAEYSADIDLLDPSSDSWAGYACKVLSTAVEVWAGGIDTDDLEKERNDEIESWEDDNGLEAPTDWASYLINGDGSGLDEAEIVAADVFVAEVIASHGHSHFHDCVERGFTMHGDYKGRDVSLYFLA